MNVAKYQFTEKFLSHNHKTQLPGLASVCLHFMLPSLAFKSPQMMQDPPQIFFPFEMAFCQFIQGLMEKSLMDAASQTFFASLYVRVLASFILED